MERCKNDRTKTYAGTEPSPRGLGWYAGADPVGKTRKGRDGARWIVTEDKNGRRTWRPVASRGGGPGAVPVLPSLTMARPATRAGSVATMMRPMTRGVPPLAIQGQAAHMSAPAVRFDRTVRFGDMMAQMSMAPPNTPCVDMKSIEFALEGAMRKMLPPGSSPCARTLASFACVAAMKVIADALGGGEADVKVADKALNVAFVSRGVGKPFDLSSDWGSIARKAAKAVAVDCAGMDNTIAAGVNEAF